MNHFLAKLVTCFIYPKEKRKQIRRVVYGLDAKFFIFSPIYLARILLNKVNKTDLLLVELNPFHMECLYSVYAYLKDKYPQIIVLATPENISLKMFPENVRCLAVYPWVVRFLDRFGYFNQVKAVFAGSYFVWKQNQTIEKYFSKYLSTGKPLSAIDHAPGKWSQVHSHYKNVHQFVLADFLSKIYQLPSLYTCLFPSETSKIKSDCKFLSVGVVGDQTRRDMDTYIDWLDQTSNNNSYVICSSINKDYVKKLNKNNVSLFVRASFSKLFQCCREAVFLPFLIHEDDLGYYKQAISGNLNLALGFGLIPIIDKRLADLYGFTDAEATIYNGKSFFYQAMSEAVNMPKSEILKKQQALKKLKEKLTTQTLQAINEIID